MLIHIYDNQSNYQSHVQLSYIPRIGEYIRTREFDILVEEIVYNLEPDNTTDQRFEILIWATFVRRKNEIENSQKENESSEQSQKSHPTQNEVNQTSHKEKKKKNNITKIRSVIWIVWVIFLVFLFHEINYKINQLRKTYPIPTIIHAPQLPTVVPPEDDEEMLAPPPKKGTYL